MSCNILIRQGCAQKLLAPMFKLVIVEKGSNYLFSIWQMSRVSLSNFMPEEQRFEFLTDGSSSSIRQSDLRCEHRHDNDKSLQVFIYNSFNDIFKWIKANKRDEINAKQLIRTLGTCVFGDSIINSRLKIKILKNHTFARFIDGYSEDELDYFFALRTLLNKLKHRQGIPLSIHNNLYEHNVFSHNIIPRELNGQSVEQEGKGDAFHVGQQTYVPQQQPNQTGNQGQALRGMAPTGPPNQASTPPNSDLKVQQQLPKNLAYLTQAPVRNTGPNYFRAPPPQSQNPRMPNHRQGQQSMYQQQSPQFVQVPSLQPGFSTAPMFYPNGAQRGRPVPVPQFYPSGQTYATLSYRQTAQNAAQPYINYTPFLRPGAQPSLATASQNLTQAQPPALPLTQSAQQHPVSRTKKRRGNLIPIIDPDTGKDKLCEMYDQDDSHPASGESSARQTPQPTNTYSKEVQNAFTKQVNMVINQDKPEEVDHSPSSALDHHLDSQSIYHKPSRAVHTNTSDLVKSGNRLHVPSRDFVLANQSTTTAKKIAPIAISLKNKETPIKYWKTVEHVTKENKQVVKEVTHEKLNNEEYIISKEEHKPKEAVISTPNLQCKKIKEITNQREEKKIQKGKKNHQSKAVTISSRPDVVQENIPLPNCFLPPVRHSQCMASTRPPTQVSIPNRDLKVHMQLQRSMNLANLKGTSQRGIFSGSDYKASEGNSHVSSSVREDSKLHDMENMTDQECKTQAIPTSLRRNVSGGDYKDQDVNNAAIFSLHEYIKLHKIKNTWNLASCSTSNMTDQEHETQEIYRKVRGVLNQLTPQTFKTLTSQVKALSIDNAERLQGVVDLIFEKGIDEPNVSVLRLCKHLAFMKVPVDSKKKEGYVNFQTLLMTKCELIFEEIEHCTDQAKKKELQLSLQEEGSRARRKSVGLIRFIGELFKQHVLSFNFVLRCLHKLLSHKDEESLKCLCILLTTLGKKVQCVKKLDLIPIFEEIEDIIKNHSEISSKVRIMLQGIVHLRNITHVAAHLDAITNFSVREEVALEDVTLHRTENAWKPTRYNISGSMTAEEKETQELYRNVRGVLNKLTPQKFETLISQIRALPIDTAERLQGVADLVFEMSVKYSVDEPNYSIAYALMCRELALIQVPANNKKEEFVNFRKLLVTRCQLEFEKNSVDEITRNGRIKEFEECTDPEKKKELQVQLEEEDRRIRRKSVGIIRFIGELFKQKMLTVNIMLRCLSNLLTDKDEESLECLCKLLTTVGKEVETEKKSVLLQIFQEMKDIVDKKHGKISSRVRFILQDVIDLKNAKWVPRRQDLIPKTMDQIQKEAHDEQLNIQVMNSGPPPRKDDRGGSGQGPDRKQRRNNVSDNDGWTSAPIRGSRTTAFSVQSDKLKTKTPHIDEPLGSVQMFGRCGSRSSIKTSVPAAPPNTAIMFTALENIGNEPDKRTMLGSRSKEPYSSKGPSLERTYKQYEDDRGSRSGSQHRSYDNSQCSTPTSVHPQSLPKTNPPVASKLPSASEEMSPKQLELKLNILEEYLNDCCTIAECDEDIKGSIPSTALSQLVAESYINVLKRSKTARLRTGYLFGQLIILNTLSLDDYCVGLEEVLSQVDDLIIDIPKIWDYLAEIVAPVLWENALPVNRLLLSCNILISQGHSSKLLAPMFKLVVEEKGPNYLSSIWQMSGVSLSDFMPADQVNDFIKEHRFEFLMCGSSSTMDQGGLMVEQIHDKLLQIFRYKRLIFNIYEWIRVMPHKINEKQFIRILATSIFEDSIVNSKLKTEILKSHYELFTRFVNGNLEHELECLFALQTLVNKLKHPEGILLSICTSLYEDNVFSHDSFEAWESSDDPAEQEGKGMTLIQLTAFFTQLKEADENPLAVSEDMFV